MRALGSRCRACGLRDGGKGRRRWRVGDDIERMIVRALMDRVEIVADRALGPYEEPALKEEIPSLESCSDFREVTALLQPA